MSQAKFLALPSIWYENMPRTIIEAFACGLPVIGSRLGAIKDIIQHKQNGLLFNPGSAESLCEQFLWANANGDQLDTMGVNAKNEYSNKYSPKTNCQQLIDI